MNAKVQKWGNSLALRIPKALAEESHLSQGCTVNIRLAKGNLVIEPQIVPHYRLEDLLKKITKDNIHSAIDTGPPLGKELL